MWVYGRGEDEDRRNEEVVAVVDDDGEDNDDGGGDEDDDEVGWAVPICHSGRQSVIKQIAGLA
jgi:hypothetical protein